MPGVKYLSSTHLILTRTWKLRTCSGSLNQRWKPEFHPRGLVCRAPKRESRTNVCKILNPEQKLGRGQVLSRRYGQLQFKGQHFLQSGRAALNNKACYQGALSCPWVIHTRWVSHLLVALELPCPESTTPGQAVCQGREKAGIPRESAGTPPDSWPFPHSPGASPGKENNAGHSCLSYHPPPLHALLLRTTSSRFTRLVGPNELPGFHFPLTKRRALLTKLHTF